MILNCLVDVLETKKTFSDSLLFFAHFSLLQINLRNCKTATDSLLGKPLRTLYYKRVTFFTVHSAKIFTTHIFFFIFFSFGTIQFSKNIFLCL